MFARSNAFEASERSIAVSIVSSIETRHWICETIDLRRRQRLRISLEGLRKSDFSQGTMKSRKTEERLQANATPRRIIRLPVKGSLQLMQ